MRTTLQILILLLLARSLSAQMVITSGAQVHIVGSGPITLHNTSLVNNGGLLTGTSTFRFTGTSNSTLSGENPVQFFELEINKSPGSSLILHKNISVTQRAIFTSGLIHLTDFDLNLGTGAFLFGEDENSRVTSNGSGQVVCTTVLNAPASANPGNLGAIITSAQNMGPVVIRRGHQSQANASGGGSSIRRYYDIMLSDTANLNATLRIQYFDAELNGIDENLLALYRSYDVVTWTNQGFSSKNSAMNFVEQAGTTPTRRWTLSAAGNALPLKFTLFNVRCVQDAVLISWNTAQELNTHHFDIQKSNDGIQWTAIGNVVAAGTGTTEKKYAFTDNTVTSEAYYRIAAVDTDGKVQYTSILRSPCHSKDVFRLWPNPVHRTVYINIAGTSSSTAIIRVFDPKGSLVKEQRAAVMQGNNQFTLDLGTLAGGTYMVSAEWDNGQSKKTMQIVKQ